MELMCFSILKSKMNNQEKMRKLIFLSLMLVVAGCMDDYYTTKFVVSTDRRIYVNAHYTNAADLLPPEDSVSCREFYWLRPAKWCYIEWGGGKSLSGLYAGRELFRVYVFDYDTILKYGYKDCRLQNRILARYDIPKAIGPDVQKRFKQIDYPPTPAMRDAGIGIYLTDDGKKDAGNGW